MVNKLVKNIVIVYPRLPSYRAHFFLQLSKKLKEIGKKLVVVAGRNDVEKKHVKEIAGNTEYVVVRAPIRGISFLGYQIQWEMGLISLVLSQRPGFVVFMYNAGILNYSLLMLLLRFKKVPFLIWGLGHRRVGLTDFQYKVKLLFKEIFLKMASGHITYSQYYAHQLIKDGFDKRRVFCAQNTIYVEDIFLNAQSSRDKSISHDEIRFLFVGALIPAKNLDKAIRVCKSLRDEGYRFLFDIVGEGAMRPALSRTIANLKLDDFVFLHGAKYGEEVAKFFREADVLLLPGTGGLAINEAMAYGLPIISTPGDGTGYDLIKNGENGFLLRYDYLLDELQEAMKYFLICESSVRYKMGKKSVEMIQEKATLANMTDSFFQAILSVSHRKANPR
jgi:glycosyltransferase involved in cell wall biosynthesis